MGLPGQFSVTFNTNNSGKTESLSVAEFYSGLSETKSPIHWWIIAPAFSNHHQSQKITHKYYLASPMKKLR